MSGSDDGKDMMWLWESSELAGKVLEGHDGKVTGIAVYSDGGRILYSLVDSIERCRFWTRVAETKQRNCPKAASFAVLLCVEKMG